MLSRAVYLAPHLGIMFNSFNAHFTCFKLSVHEVVSFIIIIQVKLSCFLCCLISLTFVAGGGGGGQTVQGGLSCPHLGIMFIFFNAHFTCFKYLNMKLIYL